MKFQIQIQIQFFFKKKGKKLQEGTATIMETGEKRRLNSIIRSIRIEYRFLFFLVLIGFILYEILNGSFDAVELHNNNANSKNIKELEKEVDENLMDILDLNTTLQSAVLFCPGSMPLDGQLLEYNASGDCWTPINGFGPPFNLNNDTSIPPCACGTLGCPPGANFFNPIDGAFYVCDFLSGDTWMLIGQPDSIAGEQQSSCDAGNGPWNDNGCAVAWGDGLGRDNGANSLFIEKDFVVVGWGVSIDDEVECAPGIYDVVICWSPGPNTDDSFGPDNCTVLSSGEFNDTSNEIDVRYNIPGNRYFLYGIHNINCSDSPVNDFNMNIFIKNRIENP